MSVDITGQVGIFISEVISIDDEKGGHRIKARVMPSDVNVADNDLPYAFPLIPKMLHIIPKVGESVIIIVPNGAKSQRYYIGPIISQDQFMYMDEYLMGATTLLKGGVKKPEESLNNISTSIGTMAKDDEIALYGRKDSDIILTDNTAKIRCGSRITENNKVTYNKETPSFIKLKHYETPLCTYNDNSDSNIHNETNSYASIVADKVLLLSNQSNTNLPITNDGEEISDKNMQKILQEIHYLPYGDKLCEFLYLFLKMFKSHTHKYDNLEPCPDTASLAFDKNYGSTKEDIENKLLSKDIGIN